MKILSAFSKTTIFLLSLLAIMLVLIFVQIYGGNEKENFQEYPTSQQESNYITADTPIRQEIYYNACGHLVTTDQTGDSQLINRTFNQLYDEGWEVFWGENGIAVLFKEESGLCPADEDKCFIADYNGQLAIFRGPLGSNAEPIEISGIATGRLASEIKEQILKGGIEFNNMEELLIALENLDEY
jgi:hypothetical protein